MSQVAPVIVSLHSTEQYYLDAAAALRSDCLRCGIDHDIVQLELRSHMSWIDVCRQKVRFFLEMQLKHRRPIFWLDVDSRLNRFPDALREPRCDIGGFLRGLRYLRDFDPLSLPRFFSPFALYFNYTSRTTAFLDLMSKLETEYSGSATDDYFLHEAWLHHRDQLSVLVLPPDLVGREWPLSGDQAIYVGISGNVSKHKAQAEQHVAELYTPARRKAVLLFEADAARKRGDVAESLMLYRRALALGPDDELAEKIGRLAKQAKSQRSHSSTDSDREDEDLVAGWKRWFLPRRSR